jgi:hypothetical protein
MRGAPKRVEMKNMDDDVPMLSAPAYRLSEDAHLRLQNLRDQLFLMSTLAFVTTTEEEEAPLEIQRGMLGKCFEQAALEIDMLLRGMAKLHKHIDKGRPH